MTWCVGQLDIDNLTLRPSCRHMEVGTVPCRTPRGGSGGWSQHEPRAEPNEPITVWQTDDTSHITATATAAPGAHTNATFDIERRDDTTTRPP